MSGKGTQDSAEKKQCVRVLQNLMGLPNVSLSVFLTQQFREYAAALNPSGEDDNASTCSDGDLLDFGEDEVDDFEEADKKTGLDMRFPKRLICMAHTLQLALAGGLKASGCRAEVDALIRDDYGDNILIAFYCDGAGLA
ncbi:hypothetical protein Tcan_13532 [Toxocara canis]|uniref:Uncharacterized protein n=1 Tax=Toxocara canis TaxID=6265 RepID=A0A0B2VDC6_TOXCA|nr:hypothetical protein Tcan_13532 [Toxocara canis]